MHSASFRGAAVRQQHFQAANGVTRRANARHSRRSPQLAARRASPALAAAAREPMFAAAASGNPAPADAEGVLSRLQLPGDDVLLAPPSQESLQARHLGFTAACASPPWRVRVPP